MSNYVRNVKNPCETFMTMSNSNAHWVFTWYNYYY